MPTTFTSLSLDRFLQPKSASLSSSNMQTISSKSPGEEVIRNEIGDYEDFFDPQESMSVVGSVEGESDRFFDLSVEDVNNAGSESYGSLKFVDAIEANVKYLRVRLCYCCFCGLLEFFLGVELSSECSPHVLHRDVTAELRKIRRSLLMEIDSRKQAEEARDIVQTQWERLAQRLSLEGLTLPTPSTNATEDEKSEADPVEELCQQIILVRAVSTSVGRETAKAEAEIELESEINSKNFEITRLSQRLHYYEVVNSEMSLRNQETVEIERTRRQKRKRRQRWLWSSVGVSLVLGSMALAWSFIPTDGVSFPTDTSHAPEVEGAANEL
ncbi:hypothetical protein IFM89_004118 [Coptis chinensis]|uniref:Uncharacterized protein n=1 Tax=Coptis chinensis TaxID=261450 RepID=A0A835H388_9MAGN|nr:hypothetical protein IFM89_004118 [Coptis chinensis]